MLSYLHSYHAGNLADVHKHSLLAWMLSYMARKDKPLSYLETHSGRALYDLDGAEAVKTGEAAAGITRVLDWFEPDDPYRRVLSDTRATLGAATYPGSPLIASKLLRGSDAMDLAELHPAEAAALREAMLPYPAVVHEQDGWQMAMSRCPPDPRRGLLLIDPSFEVKDDYATIARFMAQISRKWPVGVLVLWYPVLTDNRHTPMIRSLKQAIPDATVHEVRFAPARPGHGMVGSGMFVVNAPYGFDEYAAWLGTKFKELE